MYYILQYTLCSDYLDRRKSFRASHFDYLTPYHDSGQLMLGGAYDDPTNGAMLLFKVGDTGIIEDFAKNDPYVRGGVVINWEIRKWNIAIGDGVQVTL